MHFRRQKQFDLAVQLPEQPDLFNFGSTSSAAARTSRSSHGSLNPLVIARGLHSSTQRYIHDKYWKFNLILVLSPCIFMGCPIFLLFDGEDRTNLNKDLETDFWKRTTIPKGPISWSKFIWTRKRYRVSSFSSFTAGRVLYWFGMLACIQITLAFNGFFLHSAWQVVDYLLLQGRVTSDLVKLVYHICISLPGVLLVDYVWIFGYQLKATVESFDVPIILENLDEFDARGRHLRFREEVVKISDNNNSNEDQLSFPHSSVQFKPSLQNNARKKLAAIYLIIIVLHVTHIILHVYEVKVAGELITPALVIKHYKYYMATISYTLGCPVFCCFCWAVYSQTSSLIRYMDNLMLAGVKMNTDHLLAIKQGFKIIARNVIHMNELFRLYLPTMIFAFALTLTVLGSGLVRYLMIQLFALMFGTPLPLDPPFPKAVFTTTTTIAPEVSEEGWGSPPVVRYIVGQLINFFLNYGIIYATLKQADFTNKYIRYIHVKLNDFASGGYPECSPGDDEVFRMLQLVKTYIHSRMERGQRRRAFVDTSGVGGYIPFVGDTATRINRNVWH